MRTALFYTFGSTCPAFLLREILSLSTWYKKDRSGQEQMVTVLRQNEVQIANGKKVPQACKEAGNHTQTYYRWRKEYGGLKLDQARRLKELEKENARLKRLVAELSIEKQVLRDVAQGNL